MTHKDKRVQNQKEDQTQKPLEFNLVQLFLTLMRKEEHRELTRVLVLVMMKVQPDKLEPVHCSTANW